MLDALRNQPITFWLAWALFSLLAVEAAAKYRQAWAVPLLIGYATVAAWYLLEPVYTPEEFQLFDSSTLDVAFVQAGVFLLLMRFFSRALTEWAFSKNDRSISVADIPADTLFYYCAYLWIFLLVIGFYRMDWDVLGALFPMGGRAGDQMWRRAAAADAGPTGFLVSTGAYLYTLVCASFGILLPFIKKKSTRRLAYILIAVSLPYFFMQGSRNVALAVVIPMIASYVLFGSHRGLTKVVMTIIGLAVIDFLFRIVIAYRDIGFENALSGIPSTEQTKHLGLNMLSELCYINWFYDQGRLQLSLGIDYLANAVNAIPRAIWPSKPIIGIDYALLRGFTGGESDIGVTATISQGLIGQGVSNFGPYFGPVVAALLFTAWLMFLARLRTQNNSAMRLTLFLLGLGLTFNIGREITLLVLWPMIFGYALVRYLEHRHNVRALGGRPILQHRIVALEPSPRASPPSQSQTKVSRV